MKEISGEQQESTLLTCLFIEDAAVADDGGGVQLMVFKVLSGSNCHVSGLDTISRQLLLLKPPLLPLPSPAWHNDAIWSFLSSK